MTAGSSKPGASASGVRIVATTLVLHWSLFAGLALFATVAVVLLWQGLFPAVFSADRTVRSAAALIVGLGSFVGLRVCRSASSPPRSADPMEAAIFQRGRSVLGAAIIDGFGIAGVCFGLLAGNARLILMLAGMALAAMFLARPDMKRLEAALGRAAD